MKIILVFFSAVTTVVFGGGLNFFLQNPGLGEWNADDISGEACTGLVRGEEGVCVMTYQCLRAKGKHVNRCYLDTGAIGSCCVISKKSSNETVENLPTATETTTNTAVSSTTSNLNKIWVDEECQIPQGRDVGEVVAISEQPWIVRIFINERNICSGTLINNGWVISAAQCFDGLSESSFRFEVVNPVSRERIVFEASVILKHPKFDITLSLAYDVALTKLRISDVVLDDLTVACVSPSADIDNVEGIVAVLGQYDQSGLPQDLQAINIQVISNKECSDAMDLETELIFDGEQMGCAGQQPETAAVSGTGQSTCSAAIGSGVIVGNRAVVGVLSWGIECAPVFQRIAPIYSWIQNIISAF